jgi:hypothetical protein
LVQGIEINFDDLQGLFRSQILDGQGAAATHERNDKMAGRNGEFDSIVADETATAGYQDGMSLGGHMATSRFAFRNKAALAHWFTTAKIMRVTSAACIAKVRSCRTLGRPLSAFLWR